MPAGQRPPCQLQNPARNNSFTRGGRASVERYLHVCSVGLLFSSWRSKMQTRRIIPTTIIALCAWAASGSPAAAQGVGAIGGTVVDSSGGALPGHGRAVQCRRNSWRQSRRHYRRAGNLPVPSPGAWHVCGEGGTAGIPPRHAGQDRRQRGRDLARRPEDGSRLDGESITVSGQSPLIDTTSALNQTVLTRDRAGRAAEPRQHLVHRPGHPERDAEQGGRWRIGVYLNSTATVHGTSSENKCMVDGMDVSSTDGNGDDRRVLLWTRSPIRRRTTRSAPAQRETQNGGLTFSMISRTGTEPVSRRRHVQRRQSRDGVRQLLRTS